jgi:hypothetical protein
LQVAAAKLAASKKSGGATGQLPGLTVGNAANMTLSMFDVTKTDDQEYLANEEFSTAAASVHSVELQVAAAKLAASKKSGGATTQLPGLTSASVDAALSAAEGVQDDEVGSIYHMLFGVLHGSVQGFRQAGAALGNARL